LKLFRSVNINCCTDSVGTDKALWASLNQPYKVRSDSAAFASLRIKSVISPWES